MEPTHLPADAPRVDVILLPPRRRNDLDEWEIRVNGAVVGWVKACRIGGARATFYDAHAFHDGKLYMLNASTDRDERINTVLRYWASPWSATHVDHR